MRHLTSMEHDDEAKMDQILPLPMLRKPDFPCGLKICLTGEEFKKMELDPSDAEVGGLVHIVAMARVTSVSHDRRDDKHNWRVEMQIEDMSIESEDDEEPDEDDKFSKGKKY